jgi:pimeloyl-ACP methyl ester carboxylesterase
VLLIGGLGDTVESWRYQLDGLADRYRVTAVDNRGAGRTAMPDGPLTVEAMADDAAGVLRALELPAAHVAGFSMGSAIAQELTLRHPQRVRSLVLVGTYARPDALFRAQLEFWRWLAEVAPAERAFFEAFFTWVYTPRAHVDGTVEQIIEEALAFPPARADRRPDARPRRRARHDPAAPRRPIRRRTDPECARRDHGRRVAPALPGDPGRVERPRRRLLARGRRRCLRTGIPRSSAIRAPERAAPRQVGVGGVCFGQGGVRTPCLGRTGRASTPYVTPCEGRAALAALPLVRRRTLRP